ncbi:MAG: VTT domain-containing protein [Patescibacteria group bacterium]
MKKLYKMINSPVVKLTITLIVLYIALKMLVLPYLTSIEFQEFIQNLGPWGYIVVVGYTVLSHVLAPLVGSPVFIVSIIVYGLNTSLTLLFITQLISSVINFWIARKYGRNLVRKLVGKKSMADIDKFTTLEGKKVLVIVRLFGFSVFDFVSYGIGLTNMKFKDYYLITMGMAVITNLIERWMFSHFDFTNSTHVSIWFGTIGTITILFTLGFGYYYNKKHTVVNQNFK